MMNAGNLKGKTRQTSDWRRRMIAFVSALTLLISSCGLTAFAESDEDIYSDPVTAPIPAANTSPEPEEGEAEATPAPEDQPETGTEPQEATGEGTEPEGEPEVSEEPEDLTVYEPGTLTAEADGIGITVDYTAEARVPEGTVLTLTRAAGGDLYSALKSASKVLKTEENATWKRELGEDAVFYAITLTNPEGNEVHPETGVTLTCTNLEIPADATGFVTGENAENLDWKDTLTVGFLPDAIGYAYLKQVQIGTVTLTHEDRDYMVTAAYGPDAGFPADTELKVREIKPGTPEYALYSGMTDEALNEDWAEITLERYFDIAFVANGEELEPKADVDVQIVFRDKIEQNEETEVAAVHIENNEANVIEAETDSTKTAVHDEEAIDTVTFTSDSFSVYGVVQKKKIITKVLAADGNTYEIEISYTQEAEIPEESQVKVEEIPEGSDLWEAYRKQTAAALNADDVRLPGLYDISIIDAEGARIEPKAPVSVSIKLANAEADNEDLHVVHFTEEIPQELVEAEAKSEEQTEVQPIAEEDKIESENIKANVEGDTVTFDTKGFSVYAFAYKIVTYYKTASGETYKITLNYDENSGVPEGSTLNVEEILPGDSRYNEYLEKALRTAVKETENEEDNTEETTELTIPDDQYARFFDIEIRNNDEKVEPNGKVSVTIELADMPEVNEQGELQIVHFADAGTEIIENVEKTTELVRFQADSFSVYAVITTPTIGNMTSLNGVEASISKNGYYLTSEILQETPTKIKKTTDYKEAATWYFESAGYSNYYYIYTFVDGEKKFINFSYLGGGVDYTNVSLTGTKQALIVERQGDGTYKIGWQRQSITFHLNHWQSDGKNGFAGYLQASNGYDNPDEHLKLTIGATENSWTSTRYAIVVHHEGEWYSVNNDGSLIPANYDPETNFVEMEYPLTWEYLSATNADNEPHILRIPNVATGFYGNQLPSGYLYRYISPMSATGIDQDRDNTDDRKAYCGIRYKASEHKLVAINQQGHESDYMGVTTGSDGTLHLKGNETSATAAEIYFAEIRSVPQPPTGNNSTHNDHTVNHIDIGVKGVSKLKVRVDLGNYYDKNGILIYTATEDNHFIEMTNVPVDVDTDDIKRAKISAYTKDTNGVKSEIKNAFYISGYSQNEKNSISNNQVRIEGSFKVADLPSIENADNIQAVREARKAKRIYYTVETTKDLTFNLVYDGKVLYQNEAPVQVTIPVTLSASFDYWDSHNECPPLTWPEYRNNWPQGYICGQGYDMTGMDFILGAEVVQEDNPAIRITKYIQNNKNQQIKTLENHTIDVDIYYNSEGNANYVNSKITDFDGTGTLIENYHNLYQKTVTVGGSGMGSIIDYDINPGMVYIHEDEGSVDQTITDINGIHYQYDHTEIHTEWTKGSGEHSAEGYTSVPEVVGKYAGRNNAILDFYVFNVYKPITNITVQKNWENASAPAGTEVRIILKRASQVEGAQGGGGSGTSTATLTIEDSCSGLEDSSAYITSYTVTGNGINKTQTGKTFTNLPLGEYTVSKTVSAVSGYSIQSYSTETLTNISVTAGGSTATFHETVFTKNTTSTNITITLKVNDSQLGGAYYHVTPQDFKVNSEVHSSTLEEITDHSVTKETSVQVPAGSTVSFKINYWAQPGQGCTVSNYGTRLDGYDFEISIPSSDTTDNIEITVTLTGATSSDTSITPKQTANSILTWLGLCSTASAADAADLHLPSGAPAFPTPESDSKGWVVDSWAKEITLTGPWSTTIPVDLEDSEGNVYVYFIDEVLEDGIDTDHWAASKDGQLVWGNYEHQSDPTKQGSVVSVTNTYTEQTKGSVRVKKTFSGITEAQIPSDFQITATWGSETRILKISGMETYVDVVRTGSGLEYTWTISNIPIGVVVSFEESGYQVLGYTATASATTVTATAAADSPGFAEITNTYTRIPDPGTLVIKKEVTTDADASGVDFSFTVELWKNDSVYSGNVIVTDKTRTAVSVPVDGEGKIHVTVTGTGTATISNIAAGTTYYVNEDPAPDNWEFVESTVTPKDSDGVISEKETETVTFTNGPLKAVYAQKVWKQNNVAMTAWPIDRKVTFQLQYNAAESGQPENWQPATIDAKDDTILEKTVNSTETVAFNNLFNDVEYRVVETAVDGIALGQVKTASSGTGTLADPYLISNDVETTIEVNKKWYDGSNTEWPENVKSVTVGLYKGDEAVKDPSNNTSDYVAAITERQNAIFTGIPVYNEQGETIQYNVKELYVTLNNGSDTISNVVDLKVTTGSKEWTVVNSDVTDRSATITNSTVSSALIVKKKWLGVIDPDTLPDVHFKLMYYYADEMGSVAGKNYWHEYSAEEFVLSAKTTPKWEYCFTDLPTEINSRTVRYFVQEIRNDMNVDDDQSVKYDVSAPGMEAQPFVIHVDGYETSQGTSSGTWQQPYGAYIEGGTGVITIRNRCPSEYMQIDIKKKILEYVPNPTGGNSSLYTMTSSQTGKRGLVMEIQLYRRAVMYDDNIPQNLKFTSKYPDGPVSDWEEYGNPMLIGYDENGVANGNDTPNADIFTLRNKGSEGDWHWTIGNTNQNGGLPRNGFYKKGDVVYPVRYQYWVVEINAYKNFDREPLDYSYQAATPAAWDGCGEGVACQFWVTDCQIAQDQDRIINLQSSDLKITKEWNNTDSSNFEVYVKLYRIDNQSYDPSKKTDITDELNTKFTDWLADKGYNIGKHAYTSATITTIEGGTGKYIVLHGDETITIHNLDFGSPSGGGYYRYWIKELGYKDKNGIHWLNDQNPEISINYSVTNTANVVYLDNWNNKLFNISSFIKLGKCGENHFTITNMLPSVTQKPEISKTLNGSAFEGKDSANQDKEFTFILTQKNVPSGQTAYTDSATSAENGSITFKDIEFTAEGTYIYEITESGTDDDTMDYDGHKIYAKIVITKSGNTLSAGEVEYYDNVECTGEPLSAAVFNNTELGELDLKKLVEVAAGSTLPDNNEDQEFVFTITLTAPTNGTLPDSVPVTIGVTTTNIDIITKDEISTITVTLKKDQTAQIKKLPVGTKYSITETNVPGYTLTWTENKGASGTISKTVSEAEATNTFNSVEYIPVAKKMLNGTEFNGKLGDGTTTESFTFDLKEMTVSGEAGSETYTVSEEALQSKTTSDEGSISFDALKYNVPGTYYYQITEQETNSPTIDCDETPVYLKVVVDDELNVEAGYYTNQACTDSAGNEATFHNTELTEVDVTKAWMNHLGTITPPEGTIIALTLYKGTGENAPPVGTAVTLNGQADTPADDQTAYEYEAWKAKWTKLPKYEDGVLITYVVKETAGAEGYTVSYQGTDATYALNNGTITNTLNEIDIDILKVNDKDEPLTGAEFKLEKLTGEVTGDTDGYTPVPQYETITINSNDGKEHITGLTDGTYRLTETKAPAGYILLSSPLTFVVEEGVITSDNRDGTTFIYTEKNDSAPDTYKIKNTPGAELPATGGSGTLIYTITGIFLITLAGTLLVARKRKANR